MTMLELEFYLTHAPRTLAWTARTVSASPPGTSLEGPSPSLGSPVLLPAGTGREWLPVGPDWNKKPTMDVYIKCNRTRISVIIFLVIIFKAEEAIILQLVCSPLKDKHVWRFSIHIYSGY